MSKEMPELDRDNFWEEDKEEREEALARIMLKEKVAAIKAEKKTGKQKQDGTCFDEPLEEGQKECGTLDLIAEWESRQPALVFKNGDKWFGQVCESKMHGKGTIYIASEKEEFEVEFNMGVDVRPYGRIYWHTDDSGIMIEWCCIR
jgi:hypothetical protein